MLAAATQLCRRDDTRAPGKGHCGRQGWMAVGGGQLGPREAPEPHPPMGSQQSGPSQEPEPANGDGLAGEGARGGQRRKSTGMAGLRKMQFATGAPGAGSSKKINFNILVHWEVPCRLGDYLLERLGCLYCLCSSTGTLCRKAVAIKGFWR